MKLSPEDISAIQRVTDLCEEQEQFGFELEYMKDYETNEYNWICRLSLWNKLMWQAREENKSLYLAIHEAIERCKK